MLEATNLRLPNNSTAHCVTGRLGAVGGVGGAGRYGEGATILPLKPPTLPHLHLVNPVISEHHTAVEFQEILTGPTRQQYIHKTRDQTFNSNLPFASFCSDPSSSFYPAPPLDPRRTQSINTTGLAVCLTSTPFSCILF